MFSRINKIKSSLPKGLEVVTRQVKLKSVNNKPRYWHHEDPFMSHLLNAASLFLPEGERFFIRAFRHFIDEIEDEKLQGEIREFIAQEAIHGNEHTKYNTDLVDNLGYDFLVINERRIKQVFAFYNRYTSKKFQLAMTLGAEHFTAIIADMVLSNPQLMKDVDPQYQEIWQWHLMEELEHKGVAMDVYNAVDGSYWKRAVAINVVLASVVPFIGYVFYKMLEQDGMLTKELWQQQKRYHRGNAPVFRQLWIDYKSFFRKDYHPWQHDNSHLVVELNRKFYSQGVIKKLARSAGVGHLAG